MKVYFYDLLRSHPHISAFEEHAIARHRLFQQHRYFLDIQQALSKFKIDDHNDADYFFVPLFLAAWQFENADPEATGIVSALKFVSRGNHLLVATGDFGQRRLSRHEMQTHPDRAYRDKYSWLDERFKLIALESTAELLPGDVAFFPYMIDEPDPALTFRKSIFASFKGAISHPHLEEHHIRGGLLEKHADSLAKQGVRIFHFDSWATTARPLKIRTRLTGLAKSLISIREKEGWAAALKALRQKVQRQLKRRREQPALTEATDPEAALSSRELMARSIFTLCPAGYGRWSFRPFEALRHNSIPVVLSDDYKFPFASEIDWDKFVLHIPESSTANLGEILGSISAAEIARRLRTIEEEQHLFTRDSCLALLIETLSRPTRVPTAEWVLPRMRMPIEMGIICIDITNKCDLACSNCTRLLENQDRFWEMTPENFRIACRSLKGYPGIIAVIGGNPCMHSRFEEIARIFEEEVPDRRQRGIWTNNAFKHSKLLQEKFGAFNLNPHGVERGVKSIKPIYDEMVVKQGFSGGFYPEHSEHAPLLAAVRDLIPEPEMWERIARCDVNKDWSAAIVQNDGKLRAYFCEVAASFDLARNQDHGMEVTQGWWKRSVESFATQIQHFCPGCGAPARLKGHYDYEEIDTYSVTNEDLALKSVAKKKRKVIRIESAVPNALGHRVTKYEKHAR